MRVHLISFMSLSNESKLPPAWERRGEELEWRRGTGSLMRLYATVFMCADESAWFGIIFVGTPQSLIGSTIRFKSCQPRFCARFDGEGRGDTALCSTLESEPRQAKKNALIRPLLGADEGNQVFERERDSLWRPIKRACRRVRRPGRNFAHSNNLVAHEWFRYSDRSGADNNAARDLHHRSFPVTRNI
jgi:hypothetical protein